VHWHCILHGQVIKRKATGQSNNWNQCFQTYGLILDSHLKRRSFKKVLFTYNWLSIRSIIYNYISYSENVSNISHVSCWDLSRKSIVCHRPHICSICIDMDKMIEERLLKRFRIKLWLTMHAWKEWTAFEKGKFLHCCWHM
jgi:hypothetical protein